MVKLTSVFVLLCTVVWVSSNPTYQRPPCPIHGTRNVNSYTPMPIPGQSLAVYKPPIYNVGPTQANNQCLNQQKTLPPIQQELGQMIVQKLFSNPTLQAILSQNAGPYTHTPNVVNNYFIVPGELFDNPNYVKSVIGRNILAQDKIEAINDIKEDIVNHELDKVVDNALIHEVVRESNDLGLGPHAFAHPDVRRLYGQRNRNCNNCRRYHRVDAKVEEPDFQIPISQSVNDNTVPSEEEILNDFRAKFPNIPEPIARNMLQQMRERVQRQYSNNYRQNLSPRNYQKFNQNIRGKPQRRRLKNRRVKPRNDTQSAKQHDNNTDNNQNATKQRAKDTEVTTNKVLDTYETTTNPTETIQTVKRKETIENTTPFVIPELGSEDELPSIDNGLDYDDYFPDFTKDNQAHNLDEIRPYEDFPPKNIQRNSRRRNRKQRKPKNRLIDKSEEVVYRSPPGLESPDFLTTQVNKKYGNDFEFKSFSDRNNKAYGEITKPSIETVFGGSKVTNYGARDSEESSRNNRYYVDDDKEDVSKASIVMARSYDPDDYVW